MKGATTASGMAGWQQGRYRTGLALGLVALIAGVYLLAELPYLDRYPLLSYDEGEVMAPAHKLAAEGVYGNDLFTGYFNAEGRVYYCLPLHQIIMAGFFKVLGTGIWQGRLTSVVAGLATILLTVWLGARLYDPTVGLAAGGVLTLLRLSLPSAGSGMPLLDIARVARYDIPVPAWLVGAAIAFEQAHRRPTRWAYLLTGALTGLATLTHAYGALMLLVFWACLLWVDGLCVLRRASVYLIGAGWLAALAPWLVYVAQDPADFRGQLGFQSSMGRFNLLNPRFYLDNLIEERWRYVTWVGGHFTRPVLWPRAGIWVLGVAVVAAAILLIRQIRRAYGLHPMPELRDTFTLLAFPVLAFLLAALVNLKIYGYLALFLPFMGLLVGYGIVGLWRALGPRHLWRGALAGLLALAAVEGGWGILHNIALGREASPYEQVLAPFAARLPAGAHVLVTQAYWLGLGPVEARSLHLPFLLSNARYSGRDAIPFSAAMQELKPEYILLDKIVAPRFLLPAAENAPELEAQFWSYLRNRCRFVTATAGTDYGPFELFSCQSS